MDVFDLQAVISIDTSEFKQKLEDASKKFNDFGKKLEGISDKMKNMGQAISGFGENWTENVSSPLMRFGKNMLQAGMEYEAGMDEVAAISGKVAEEDLPEIINAAKSMGLSFKESVDATSTAMEILGEKAMDMAAKTKFSTGESAEAYKYMAMAGWKTTDMLNSLDAVMYLAGASGESLGATSDIVTDAMTAFGMAADETSKVLKDGVEVEVSNAIRFTDVLAAASNNANTNVSMMGETFKYAASVAGSLGYSVEDVAIASGLMANSGIKASMAGTSLRSIMTRLATNAGKTQTEMGALEILTEKLGVEFYDTEGKARDFNDVLMEAREAWRGLGDEESTYYAKKIAGQYAIAGWLSIMNASDKDVDKLTEAIYNSNGATEEMYNVMTDNAQGAVTMLDSAINVLYTSMSQHIIPIFTDVVRAVTAVVNWFGSLDDGTQKLILTIGGIAIAVGPVLTVIGNIITAIGTIVGAVGGAISVVQNIGSAFSGLFAVLAANPIAIVVAAVAALAAGLIVLWNTNEDFRNAVGEIWEAITGFFTGAVDKIKGAWEGVTEFFGGIWDGIQSVFATVVEALGEPFQEAAEAIQTAWTSIVEFFSGVWESIQGIFAVAEEVIGGFFSAALDAVETAWDTVIGFFQGIWDGIEAIFSVVAEVLGGFFADAVDAIKKAWSTVVEFFDGIWNAVKNAAESAAKSVGNFFKDALETIKNAWDGVTGFFSGIFDDIVGTFSDIGGAFLDIGGDIVDGLKKGISGAWSGLTGAVGEKVNSLVSGVKGALGIHSPSTVFAGIGENMALGLSEGWAEQYNSVKSQIKRGMDFGTASIGLTANGTGYSFNESGGASNRRGGFYGETLQPVTIVVQSVLNERIIGETSYQYMLNRERAYGGR